MAFIIKFYLKNPIMDSHDLLEKKLLEKKSKSYQNYVDSEYNYLKHIRNKKITQFQEETQNYIWNKEHFYYKYMFETSNICIDINKETGEIIYDKPKKIIELYHKFSLICHPDKCKEEWGKNIFILIKKAYDENNIELLEKINLYYEENKTLENYKTDNFKEEINKEEQINKWKSELWYHWYYVNNSMVKNIFIPIEKALEKVKKENIELKDENVRIKDELENLNKTCDK
jgi:hypothetical protein